MAGPPRKPPVIPNPAPWPRAGEPPAPPIIRPWTQPAAPRAASRSFARPQPIASRHSLLLPEELERYKNLLVFARTTVEGYFSGKHRSPYRGTSVEFTDYKPYVAGDEVGRIDWRAYGRTRRLYVRQYEAETDMVVYLLVDSSASMSYAGPGRQSKYLIAAKIAAALAYLMLAQGDKASLVLFSEKLNRYLTPGGTRRHLHQLVTELERVEASASTGMSEALHQCATLFKKRGRLVVLSDFWTDLNGLLDALSQFQHRKYEILLLQVLDPDELILPAGQAVRFHDLETHEEVEADVNEIREIYCAKMQKQVDFLAREASSRRIDHAVVNTARPYLEAIEAYLGFRERTNAVKPTSGPAKGAG